MNRVVTGALLVLIVILIGGVGYYIFQNQKLINKLSQQPQTSQTSPSPQALKSTSPNTATSPSPSPINLKENIEAAVNSKNFAAIATYVTTPKVNFSLMSSGCCEPKTPEEAAAQMDYIKDGVPMDFNQQNPKIVHIKEKKPEFASAFIGVSKSNEQVAIFVIDSNNKISAIQLSLSYKFYDF